MSHKRIKSNFAFTFFEGVLSPFNVALTFRVDIRSLAVAFLSDQLSL